MNMTQSQLEALVDLLVYASVTDARFTLLESDAFETSLEHLPWQSNIGLSGFVSASHARVNVLETPESKREYLEKRYAVFTVNSYRFNIK